MCVCPKLGLAAKYYSLSGDCLESKIMSLIGIWTLIFEVEMHKVPPRLVKMRL